MKQTNKVKQDKYYLKIRQKDIEDCFDKGNMNNLMKDLLMK